MKSSRAKKTKLLSFNLRVERNRIRRSARAENGFTLIELIITMAILAILAGGTIPIARNLIRREKEKELARNLREIRNAIDSYKVACDREGISMLDAKLEDACYPAKLEVLVEGVTFGAAGLRAPVGGLAGGGGAPATGTVRRFLRRIPRDPFTGEADWGLRSVQDDRDSSSWGGQNVYDVYSKAPGTALDGKTQYKDW